MTKPIVPAETVEAPVKPVEPEPIDVSVYQAKIDELEAEKVAAITRAEEAEKNLSIAKADNYDLVMSMPSQNVEENKQAEIPDTVREIEKTFY